jgi:hypothetical protein
MDVLAFLKDRVAFIQTFYTTASGPFLATKRKIESGEPPFDAHLAKYEDEPPFTTEWIEADRGLEVLGRVCVSMLSASLKLFLNTWCNQLGLVLTQSDKSVLKLRGTIAGFKHIFNERLGTEWTECPADFAVLEQVFLARNRDQHPDTITRQSVSHRSSDLKRFSEPFFMSDIDRKILADPVLGESTIFPFDVKVTHDKLFVAIREVELLCEWLEPRLLDIKWHRKT